MKFRLLVVDDDLDTSVDEAGRTRRHYYDFLADQFDLEYPPSLEDAVKASQVGVSAVLLDFVLAKWGTDALSVLPQLDKALPIGLISKHWIPNFEKLRQALNTFPQIAQLFTWEDLVSPERRGLISMWLSRAISHSEGHASSKSRRKRSDKNSSYF